MAHKDDIRKPTQKQLSDIVKDRTKAGAKTEGKVKKVDKADKWGAGTSITTNIGSLPGIINPLKIPGAVINRVQEMKLKEKASNEEKIRKSLIKPRKTQANGGPNRPASEKFDYN